MKGRLLLKLTILTLLINISNIQFTTSYLSDRKEIADNHVSTTCWLPPSIPVLVYPADNTFAGTGSEWNLHPYMDWQNSSTTCPLSTTITYQYESYRDASLTQLVYRSGWLTNSQIPASGTPEGVYYWRVRAKDNHGNISNFSSPWRLIVDRTAPSPPSLSITGSYTKAVEEKIINGDFSNDLDGWAIAGDVTRQTADTVADYGLVLPQSSSYMVRLGQDVDPANYLWDNRLLQSFGSGAKSMSIDYNFFTRDIAPYDDPGFLVRLNGQNIFSLNPDSVGAGDEQVHSTGWQQFIYDLSDQDTDNLNLAIYSGNNGDQNVPSWAYISRVTTYFVSAPLHATYSLAATDNPTGSGLDHFSYSLDNSNWTHLGVGSTFSLSTAGSFNLWYYSVDRAGNHSSVLQVKILVDDIAPSATTIEARDLSSNSAIIAWLAPGNDADSGRASKYDLRYAPAVGGDCVSFDFNSAANILVQPAGPQPAGLAETYQLLGLEPDTLYCAALKSADEAPNWSSLSNVLSFSTTSSPYSINSGDLVINELMWSGSDPANQFLELRNLTDRSLDLTGLLLTKSPLGVETTMAIDFTGRSVSPRGYFLIAKSSAFFNASVTPDIVTDQLDLSATSLYIKLYHDTNLLDLAGNGTPPFEGTVTYSMERISSPGDGSNPANWYTCIDIPSNTEFFSLPEYQGTPKTTNRSENEPLAHRGLLPPRPTATVTPTPQPPPVFSINFSYQPLSHKIILDLINPPSSLPDYEITYQSAGLDKGVAGAINSNHFEIFLGTCSTGGTCLPDPNLGPQATIRVGDITQTLNLQ